MTSWCPSVVVFHHVHPDIDYYTNTPPEAFARQIEWLAAERRLVSIAEANRIRCESGSDKDIVIVTFDDGYEDNERYALPILAHHGAHATFFVLVDYIGQYNNWNIRCGYRAMHMTGRQLTTLVAEGHEIGSHGCTHRRMTELHIADSEREIASSQIRLAEDYGIKASTFAFPFGSTNCDLNSIASQHYASSFSTVKSSHRNWALSQHGLRRSYIPAQATRNDVLRILQGWEYQ